MPWFEVKYTEELVNTIRVEAINMSEVMRQIKTRDFSNAYDKSTRDNGIRIISVKPEEPK